MKKILSYLKLVMINCFVLLILLWSLNLMASVYLDGRYWYKQVFVPISKKAYTPSLEDQPLTKLIYREKKQLETRYVPYMAWSRKPFSGKTTTINPEGDRTHLLTTDSPIRHIRFFGGSTMWGSGVDDQNTIPAHFNALHQNYRAYNHGQSGFVSRQELARLVNLVNQNSPMDVIIFYDGCNDSLSLCDPDVSINGHREQAKMANKLEYRWQVVDDLIGPIGTVIQKIGKPKERPISQCQSNPVYPEMVASTLVNNWKIARAVAALGGADFHAILQPVAPIGQPNIEYLSQRQARTDFHLVYPLVLEIKKREHLDWIHDLTDAFDVDEYIYIDSCHVNGRGNAIIAQKISELLSFLSSR
ncbi:MAG: SGNH/GDSL hydrolase family protein [Nitrospirales bacterium]